MLIEVSATLEETLRLPDWADSLLAMFLLLGFPVAIFLAWAFEVTPGGEIVWEFLSPHRAGQDGALIATLYEMLRLPEDFPTEWAEPPAP